MRIATLATSHNRREKTLSALRDLHHQQSPKGTELVHTLVDDGSDDGTAAAIRETYPDVTILDGTGELYWAGGMRFGWANKVSKEKFDYLFVYNDDVGLRKDALKVLFDASAEYLRDGGTKAHVVVGAFVSKSGNKTSYGGLVRDSTWHPLRFRCVDPPKNKYVAVDTLNMNGALITRGALEAVGFLSDYFIHTRADFEYGLKLSAAGGRVLLAPGYIGVCERNNLSDQGNASSFLAGFRELVSVKRQPPKQRMQYYARFGGWYWPFLWIMPYLSFPLRWILSGRGDVDRRTSS